MCTGTTLKCYPQNKEAILPTVLGFAIDKKSH